LDFVLLRCFDANPRLQEHDGQPISPLSPLSASHLAIGSVVLARRDEETGTALECSAVVGRSVPRFSAQVVLPDGKLMKPESGRN
jgi:hypothetical protein